MYFCFCYSGYVVTSFAKRESRVLSALRNILTHICLTKSAIIKEKWYINNLITNRCLATTTLVAVCFGINPCIQNNWIIFCHLLSSRSYKDLWIRLIQIVQELTRNITKINIFTFLSTITNSTIYEPFTNCSKYIYMKFRFSKKK